MDVTDMLELSTAGLNFPDTFASIVCPERAATAAVHSPDPTPVSRTTDPIGGVIGSVTTVLELLLRR
jgi:hypothetical protein